MFQSARLNSERQAEFKIFCTTIRPCPRQTCAGGARACSRTGAGPLLLGRTMVGGARPGGGAEGGAAAADAAANVAEAATAAAAAGGAKPTGGIAPPNPLLMSGKPIGRAPASSFGGCCIMTSGCSPIGTCADCSCCPAMECMMADARPGLPNMDIVAKSACDVKGGTSDDA